MLNFTVGPVMSSKSILGIGSEQVPYFRTQEFSEIMLQNEILMKKFANADENSRVVFMTGSGTLSMEAAVINVFSRNDKVLVIDGGNFGHRFVNLLEIYHIPHEVIKPKFGSDITDDQLNRYDDCGFTGFLVNYDETSLGILYDIGRISNFCKRNRIFLVVDCISSFLCDPFHMKDLGVQIMITGSQKGLACPPGVSALVLSSEAVSRIYSHNPQTLYLDLKIALDNQERGQTPFTCAVGIMLQINCRLREIDSNGGVNSEILRVMNLSKYFRKKLADESLPLNIISNSLPNAVTPLSPTGSVSAYNIFEKLKDDYNIWVCPNGGLLKDKVFRVGHMGNINNRDYDILIDALKDMNSNGLL